MSRHLRMHPARRATSFECKLHITYLSFTSFSIDRSTVVCISYLHIFNISSIHKYFLWYWRIILHLHIGKITRVYKKQWADLGQSDPKFNVVINNLQFFNWDMILIKNCYCIQDNIASTGIYRIFRVIWRGWNSYSEYLENDQVTQCYLC